MRSLGAVCSKDQVLLAVAVDGALVSDPHERLQVAMVLEQTGRLKAMQEDVARLLTEVQPDRVAVLLPETTYKDSYVRIAPRVALETLICLACVEAQIPVEMLKRVSVRSRLGFSRSGQLAEHVNALLQQNGSYWKTGRNLAAAAALAGTV